jgi:FkbM family methyltransferase
MNQKLIKEHAPEESHDRLQYNTAFQYLNINKNKTFMQVGVNSGNDAFLQICKVGTPNRIILVDPHTRYNKQINQQYKKFNYFKIDAAVATDEDIKEIKLYHLDNEKSDYYSNISTTCPMNDWNVTDDQATVVPAMTMSHIFKENTIDNIELLSIDTEGSDCSILNSINFNEININNIIFEKWGFNSEECYPSEYQQLHGTNGDEFITNKLNKLGYNIYSTARDFFCSKKH